MVAGQDCLVAEAALVVVRGCAFEVQAMLSWSSWVWVLPPGAGSAALAVAVWLCCRRECAP